jgi:hypothetical protein
MRLFVGGNGCVFVKLRPPLIDLAHHVDRGVTMFEKLRAPKPTSSKCVLSNAATMVELLFARMKVHSDSLFLLVSGPQIQPEHESLG